MIAAANSRSAMNAPKAARAKPFPVEITVLQRRCSLCRGYDDVNKSAYPAQVPQRAVSRLGKVAGERERASSHVDNSGAWIGACSAQPDRRQRHFGRFARATNYEASKEILDDLERV